MLEEHVSPDGQLRFRVVTDEDGVVTLGFDGFPWHTHADILAVTTGRSVEEVVRQFVGDLLSGESVIVLWSVGDELRDVCVSDDPARDASCALPGESVVLRYWDGRRWSDESADRLRSYAFAIERPRAVPPAPIISRPDAGGRRT